MGLWDQLQEIGDGAWDMVEGTWEAGLGAGELVVDSVLALPKVARGDLEGGAKQFTDSLQENVMQQAMGGLFGPDGLLGTAIGALPEGVRGPGRTIIDPTLQAWDWTMKNVVDRPLGTYYTMLSINGTGGPTSLVQFDFDTWQRAWNQTEERSFGQAVAAGLYRIDPFDEAEFNELRDDPMFNLISGTADFVQEFVDPIDLALGGSAGVITGSVGVGVGRANFARTGRWSTVGMRQTVGTPTRILGVGISPDTTARWSASRIDNMLKSPQWRAVNEALDEAPDVATRYARLNEQLGRAGRNLNDQARLALASARTSTARDTTMRALAGDTRVFGEVAQRARAVKDRIADPDLMGRVDDFYTARKALDDYDAGLIELGDDEVLQFSRTVETAGPDVARFADEFDAVDWATLFDLEKGVFESQQAAARATVNGLRVDPNYLLTRNTGPAAELAELAFEQIVDAQGRGISGRLWAEVDDLPYRRTVTQRVLHRRMAENGAGDVVERYVNPSVLGGGRGRVFRSITEKLPQRVIEFGDPSSYQQFERMLSQASEVVVDGERLIDSSDVGRTLAEYAELRRGGNHAAMAAHFNDTVEYLTRKFDGMVEGRYDATFGSLWDQYNDARTLWGEAAERTASSEKARATSVLDNLEGQRGSTVVVDLGDDGVTAFNLRMSPSQASASAIMPRFDLVSGELRRVQRRQAGGVTRRAQLTRDGVRSVTLPVRAGGAAAMSIWRPAVLLTPKWPLRVGIDEQLRMASNIGAADTIRNLSRSVGDLRRNYAARSIGGFDGVADNLIEAVDQRVREALDANPEFGRAIDELTEAEKFDMIGGIDGVNEIARDLIKQQIKDTKGLSRKLQMLAGARGAALGALVGSAPVGAAYYGVSLMRRRTRIRQQAERVAAQTYGQHLQQEARRLLATQVDAADAYAAEALLRRGRAIADNAGRDIGIADEIADEVMNTLDRADELMEAAGFPLMNANGVKVRGAFGDDPRAIEQNARAVSSNRSMQALYRGVHGSEQRRLERFVNSSWTPVDILDDTVSAADKGRRFERLMNLYSPRGDAWNRTFYDVVWDNTPRQERAAQLATNIATDPDLRVALGIHEGITGSALDEIAEQIVLDYDNVLPLRDEFLELRAAVRQGDKVTWTEVQRILDDMAGEGVPWQEAAHRLRLGDPEAGIEAVPGFGRALSPEVVAPERGAARLGARVNQTIENAFQILGSDFTDNLARNPYFRARYEAEVARRIGQLNDSGKLVDLPADRLQAIVDDIEKGARERALTDTRTLLYDLAEETRFGEVMANLIPFYNAWGEVMSRWAGLTLDNPYFTAKMVRLYDAEWDAPTLGLTEVEDDNGSKYIMFRLAAPSFDQDGERVDTVWSIMPQSVRDLLVPSSMQDADNTLRFSKDGLNTMLQSTTPGFGPLVTVPVREAILKNPELEETFEFMFPFGHPNGNLFERTVMEQAPTWARSLREYLVGGPRTDATVNRMFIDLVTQRADAGNPIDFSDKVEVEAAIDEANRRAKEFFLFRTFSGLLSPTSATMVSPYQPLIDEYYRMREENYETADQKFLEKYGEDFFYLTGRMTRLNDGVAASLESEELYMKHQELVSAYPDVGGWITLSGMGATDEQYIFSDAVYTRQRNMQISGSDERMRREVVGPVEIAAERQSEIAWDQYNQIREMVRIEQDRRKSQGMAYSLSAESMLPIKLWQDEQIAKLEAAYPLWAEQRADFAASTQRFNRVLEGFMAGLEDEAILQRPSTAHVVEYFEARNMVQGELQRRYEAGGSRSLEASTNTDVLLWWEQQREEMSGRPEFSAIYDRFFERDTVDYNTFLDFESLPGVLR